MHHLLLLGKLERVFLGKIPRLMVFMPPGSAKSTYMSVVGPTWFMGLKLILDRTARMMAEGEVQDGMTAYYGQVNPGSVIKHIDDVKPQAGVSRNRLLATMLSADFERLRPYLERVLVKQRQTLRRQASRSSAPIFPNQA